MTPAPTILHIPAGVGVDQSVRDEHVPPGQANLNAENVRITKSGALVKRAGFTASTSTRLVQATRTVGKRAAAFQNTLVTSDGTLVDRYSPTQAKFIVGGRIPECLVTKTGISGAGREVLTQSDARSMYDVAYASGYYIVVAREPVTTADNFKIIGYVIDATSLAVVLKEEISATDVTHPNSTGLRVATDGSNVVVVWGDGTNLRGSRLSIASMASGFSTPVVLATDNLAGTIVTGGGGLASSAGPGRIDIVMLTTRFAVAHANNSGGTARITVRTFDQAVDALTAITFNAITTVTASSNTISSLSIAGAESEQLWVVYGVRNDPLIYVTLLTPVALSVLTANATPMYATDTYPTHISLERTGANQVYVAAASTPAATNSWRHIVSGRMTSVAGVPSADRRYANVTGYAPGSKPFVVNSRVYMELLHDDDVVTPARVLVDVTGDAWNGEAGNITFRPIGCASQRLAVYSTFGEDSGQPGMHVASKSSTEFAVVHFTLATATTFSIDLVTYNFGSDLRQMPVVFAGSVYWAGGLVYKYDGIQVSEDGFVVGPRVLASTGSAVAPTLTGTFAYTAVYEYASQNGEAIVSQAAPVVSSTVAGNKINVMIRTCAVTWKEGNDPLGGVLPFGGRKVQVKIYRTTNGGGEYYLLTTFFRDGSSTIFTYADDITDATLITRAKLYRAPGRLGTAKDRQSLGCSKLLTECNGVLVSATEQGSTLRCTAERVVGEAPWHNDGLQLQIDGDGDITALASLDGTVVVFKRTAIYLVPIEPANANLSAGGFGAARAIAVDAGCIDPRSVVVTSLGIFFQSDRGIELLTRSLTVQFIGQKIQDTFALYPTVTAAVLDVKNALVRFSLAQTGSTTVGITAVFDLTLSVWAGFDIIRGAAASAQATSAAYAYHAGAWRYVWLDSVGTVRYEDQTTWLDGETWVTAMWETAWIKPELQRESQFWQAILLHQRKSACGLLGEIAWDWAAYDAADNKTWAEAAITTYTRQVDLRLTGRGQAFKCRFTDTAPATLGTGQGLEFVGLSTDFSPHQGPTQGTPRLAEASRR